MIQVGLLTEEQKENLIGQLVQPDWYFNPIQDCDNNWIISTQEINSSYYPQNEWVKELPLIDWCVPYTPSGSTENYV